MLEISSLVPLPRHYLVGRISKLKILIAASFHSKRSDAKQLAASRHSFVPRISPAPVCRTSPQWYEVQPPQLRTSQTSFEPYPLEILDPLKRSASWKQLTRGEPGDPCWLSARTRGRWKLGPRLPDFLRPVRPRRCAGTRRRCQMGSRFSAAKEGEGQAGLLVDVSTHGLFQGLGCLKFSGRWPCLECRRLS